MSGFLWVILWISSLIWKGFVVQTLWRWFVVPLGVPELALWQAIGISGLVALLVVFQLPDDDDDDELSRSIILSFAWPLLILTTCAVVHSIGT